MNYDKKILTWDDVYKNIQNIVNEINNDKIKIDLLLPVIKGGFIPAMFIAKHIGIDKFSFIQARRSKSNLSNCDFGDAKFLGLLNKDAIKGANVLIVEDIVYTGDTLKLVLNEIKKYSPKNIYICSMYSFYTGNDLGHIYKGNSNPNEVNWIVFPWDYEHPYK